MASTLTGLSRFQALWQRNLVEGATDDSSAIHERLLDGYNEPHRHYHTLDHIEHCLGMFEQCKSLVNHADTLELAIWFHDAILDPARRDNEARSTELYLQLSGGAQSEVQRQAVHRLIMSTLHDSEFLDDDDSIYMVDIDLSSFGLPWDEFLRDSRSIRAERSQLSDENYYLNQTRFQRSLLARPRFYLSDFFFDRLETRARTNLARYFDYIKTSN
jgi:predicted metal-dependent HD superfamily phosphohydrolase